MKEAQNKTLEMVATLSTAVSNQETVEKIKQHLLIRLRGRGGGMVHGRELYLRYRCFLKFLTFLNVNLLCPGRAVTYALGPA